MPEPKDTTHALANLTQAKGAIFEAESALVAVRSEIRSLEVRAETLLATDETLRGLLIAWERNGQRMQAHHRENQDIYNLENPNYAAQQSWGALVKVNHELETKLRAIAGEMVHAEDNSLRRATSAELAEHQPEARAS